MNNGLGIVASISCFVVAIAGFFAPGENGVERHWRQRGHMGAEWLANIFPFGLALDSMKLSVVTRIALPAALLLRWAANSRQV